MVQTKMPGSGWVTAKAPTVLVVWSRLHIEPSWSMSVVPPADHALVWSIWARRAGWVQAGRTQVTSRARTRSVEGGGGVGRGCGRGG
nr:hypothetical protein DA06_12295 [Georgenia sp. SUBG003]